MLTESLVTEMIGVPLSVLTCFLNLSANVKIQEHPDHFTFKLFEHKYSNVGTGMTMEAERVECEMQLCRPFKVWWYHHAHTNTLHIAPASADDLMFSPEEMFMQVAELAASDLKSEERPEFLVDVKDVLDLAPDVALTLPLAQQRSSGALVWFMDAIQKYIGLHDGQVGMDWSRFRVSLGRGVYRGEKEGLPGLLDAFKQALLGLKSRGQNG